MIFHGDPLLRPSPDNLTVAQFILDFQRDIDRPIRKNGHPWLVDEETGKAYGYQEVRTRVQGLANALKFHYRIVENDVVCLFSPNHIDYAIAIWAVHRLGAVITTANPAFTTEELVHQLMTAQARFIITDISLEAIARDAARKGGISNNCILFFSSNASASPAAPSKTIIDDLIADGHRRPFSFSERKLRSGEARTKLAFLSFSSGTTGRPKAVAIPHYAVITNILQIAIFYRVADPKYDIPWDQKRFRPGDVAAGVLPLFHIYGLLVNLHFMLYAGLTVLVTPKFVFENFLKSIVRYQITHALIVPSHVVLLCKHPEVKEYDLSSLRFVLVAAASLSPGMTLQLQKILPHSEIGQGYGMTETCTAVAMYPLSQRLGTPGSVGHLLPGVRAKVVRQDGTVCGYDEPGELVVTGQQMALGYFNDPLATEEVFVDGWVRTGDEALIKGDGDVFIVDRLKEIFKVRGFQVAPAELEGHILAHPDVSDVGVVGLRDPFSGEIPIAFVTLITDLARKIKSNPREGDRIKASIIQHVAEAKVRYKWLAGGVEFTDTIPKNAAGKILRWKLRDQATKISSERKSSQAGRMKL